MLRTKSGLSAYLVWTPSKTRGTLGRIGYLSEDRDLPDWMTSPN
jgi:hypothetical protein